MTSPHFQNQVHGRGCSLLPAGQLVPSLPTATMLEVTAPEPLLEKLSTAFCVMCAKRRD